MEGLSNIAKSARLPLKVRVPLYIMDHQYRGSAVLPAVEAMEILAASTLGHVPGAAVHSIQNARFDKFLVIEKGCNEIEAFNDLEVFDQGAVVSRLITKTRSKKAMITRTKEHAVLRFDADCPKGSEPLPLKIPRTPGYHVSVETIYKDLVPFGLHYHNLKEGVSLWEEGAEATVYAPRCQGSPVPLGSPFPLDAAFHAACVWGQRYAGMVGFPVGFGLRRVFSPTRAGETYAARISPRAVRSDQFSVTIWIKDMAGVLLESVRDVVMKDVSGGKNRPPSWIMV